ncbi:hypothetical protein GE061_011441 [Apolygus lucorum]|uniref:Uncharacterized protein n=1 Tax=Apolygus lucorum TaxID=248454 RepID=A0A6A4J3B4_APOLU|nr:hypothetical protein GE061_011441 [Apolygus lucorum]
MTSQVTQIPRGGDYFSEDADDGSPRKPIVVKNKWEGEDEDEDVLDSWDMEEEEKPEEPQAPAEKSSKKNLKKLGDKFEEKERKKREAQMKEKTLEEMTPEERLAEKLRQQKLQEESDLCLAKEVFGVGKVLEEKEDYDKLKDDVLKIVQDGVKNANFVNFAEELVQALCIHMNSTDIKKIHTKLGNLQIEKSKLEKGDKSKKSKAKAKIKVERDQDYSDFSAYTTEEFDDFI